MSTGLLFFRAVIHQTLACVPQTPYWGSAAGTSWGTPLGFVFPYTGLKLATNRTNAAV